MSANYLLLALPFAVTGICIYSGNRHDQCCFHTLVGKPAHTVASCPSSEQNLPPAVDHARSATEPTSKTEPLPKGLEAGSALCRLQVDEPSGAPATGVDLQSLKLERVKVLEELVQLLMAQNDVGSVSQTEIAYANLNLINARLDAAQTDTERIELLTKAVQYWRNAENEARVRVEVGTIQLSGYHLLRAEHLHAEIILLKFQESTLQNGE
jgi:hypothetical protein